MRKHYYGYLFLPTLLVNNPSLLNKAQMEIDQVVGNDIS
ncbi:putative cytochrome P450 [Corchorus olitorius]|uniref:Cytochrome P450 n=1 Tax=Corchorus olitorius TaxID=93759 RepID=A0A1R3K355_9ROSI|nr:putative cytochrome P450 [Corchorus olitorius]